MIKEILVHSTFVRKNTRFFRKILDQILYSRQNHQDNIAKYKNIYKDKPMLVIGNGPSLNKTPLDDFIGIKSIGMNKINLLFNRVKWRPSIITCVNGMVIQQNKEFFESTDIPVFLDFKAHYLKVQSKNINYFYTSHAEDFSHDFSKRVGNGPTVTYHSLQLAYFLGANPIIIFGVDHSFNTERNKEGYVKSESDDVNHFDPNYFGKGSIWGLPDLDGSEISYLKVKKAFEDDGRKVYDATIDGKLEIFDKISVEDAKKLCGIK